jgi:hypothetical protein
VFERRENASRRAQFHSRACLISCASQGRTGRAPSLATPNLDAPADLYPR